MHYPLFYRQTLSWCVVTWEIKTCIRSLSWSRTVCDSRHGTRISALLRPSLFLDLPKSHLLSDDCRKDHMRMCICRYVTLIRRWDWIRCHIRLGSSGTLWKIGIFFRTPEINTGYIIHAYIMLLTRLLEDCRLKKFSGMSWHRMKPPQLLHIDKHPSMEPPYLLRASLKIWGWREKTFWFSGAMSFASLS